MLRQTHLIAVYNLEKEYYFSEPMLHSVYV
jgi:hypothetical protein